MAKTNIDIFSANDRLTEEGRRQASQISLLELIAIHNFNLKGEIHAAFARALFNLITL